MQIMISGMHRSGTSVLARILNMMGTYFGQEGKSTGASAQNAKGFWERRDVRNLNDSLLHSINCDWHKVHRFNLSDIPNRELNSFNLKASSLILDMDAHRPWFIKEPRLCLLLPLWLKLLEVPVCIHIYRNPIEVSRSLNVRNQIPLNVGCSLWEYYNVSALNASIGIPVIFIKHRDLLTNPMATTKFIYEKLQHLGLQSLHLPMQSELSSFIDMNLYHEQADIDDFKSELSIEQLNLCNEFESDDMPHSSAMHLCSNNSYDILAEYEQMLLTKEANSMLNRHSQSRTKPQKDITTTKKRTETSSNGDPSSDDQRNLQSMLDIISSQQRMIQAQVFDLKKQKSKLLANEEHINKMLSGLAILKRKHRKDLASEKTHYLVLAQSLETSFHSISANTYKATSLKEKNHNIFHSLLMKQATTTAEGIKSLEDRINKCKNTIFQNRNIKILRSKQKALFHKFMTIQMSFMKIPSEIIGSFDAASYLQQNADVRIAVRNGHFESALEHFVLYGFDEISKGGRKLSISAPTFKADHDPSTDINISSEFMAFLNHQQNPINGTSYEHSDIKANIDNAVEAFNNGCMGRSQDKSSIRTETPKPSERRQIIERTTQHHHNATVDIVLPVHNALDDVTKCIESLYKHNTYKFNLIVVDDCSNSETQSYLKEQSSQRDFQIIRNKSNLRFTKTVNKGLAVSKSEYVILLNSDTIVTAFWIEKMLSCFKSDHSIGIVGPLSNAASWQTVPIRDDAKNGGWLINKIPEDYSIDNMCKLIETTSLKQYPSVPFINGFCYAISRDVIEAIGHLDEDHFPNGYGEEDDFSIRAQRAGFTLAVADDTYIFHAKAKSYKHEARKIFTKEGREALDRKHGSEKTDQLVQACKDDHELPSIREHIHSYMQIASENKKVVYTAIFGDYDRLHEPEYINKDFDYVCFTDNRSITSKVYTIKYVSPVFSNPTKNARMIKILSHIFLIGYDYSLWIDGSVKIRGRNIDELIHKNNDNSQFICLHKHVKRNCIYDEADACIESNKDNPDIITKQIESYRYEGLPKGVNVAETAEILRQQKHPDTIRLNNLWWEQLSRHSIRDQISFAYVCWKYNFDYTVMEGYQWLDPYFNIYDHGASHQPSASPQVSIIIIFDEQDSKTVKSRINALTEKTNYQNYRIITANMSNSDDVDKTLMDISTESHYIEFCDIRKKKSVAEARNHLASKVPDDYICFMKGSLESIESNWLTLLVNDLLSNDIIAAVGPTILNSDYNIRSCPVHVKLKDQQFIEAADRKILGATGNVYAINDACILLRKDYFEEAGRFSSNHDSFLSSVDLCFKFLESKLRVRLILNSQMIDHSSETAPDDQNLKSHSLRTKWKTIKAHI